MNFVENHRSAQVTKEQLRVFECTSHAHELAIEVGRVGQRLGEGRLARASDAREPHDGVARERTLHLFHPEGSTHASILTFSITKSKYDFSIQTTTIVLIAWLNRRFSSR